MSTFNRSYTRIRRNLLRTPSTQIATITLVIILLGALMIGLLGLNVPFAGRVDLSQGQVAPFDIVSPQQITYVSDILTEQARERAGNAVPNQYDSAAGTVRRTQVLLARELVAEIGNILLDDSQSYEEKMTTLLALDDTTLSPDNAAQILALSPQDWSQVATEMPAALDRIMRDDIRPEDLPGVQRRAPSVISADLSEDAAQVGANLIQLLVRPNTFPNQERTQEMRDTARAEVSPQTVTIERDETILRAGDIATPEDVETLAHIGLLSDQWNLWTLLRAVIFVVLLLAVTVGALYRMRTRTWHRFREFSILVLLSVIWMVLARFMITPHAWLPYLYPLAAFSMLIACLINVRTAVVLTVSLSLLAHYMAGNNAELIVYLMAGGLTGAVVLARAERISVFLWSALAVALANVAAMAAFRLPFDSLSNTQLLQLLFVMLLNGGLSASIALLGYFALGNLFGLTTSLQLNELSRPTHPLLRQLLLKAPGTYHHTIVVSNMAERAAAAIGADALLARVGAYYHDIGKTVRPYFFAENISDGGSPHDKLDPETSAQIIISHVRDGVDLAQKYRLPRRIQDFIREHHGVSLVQYFYVRALRSAVEGEVVNEGDFRYPGPRPQSKETAVLALADTCEAAVRAMRPATREELAAVVNRLIDERADDGELNESMLTFADVETIREVFLQVLQGVHHPRIAYPDASESKPGAQGVAVSQASEKTSTGNGAKTDTGAKTDNGAEIASTNGTAAVPASARAGTRTNPIVEHSIHVGEQEAATINEQRGADTPIVPATVPVPATNAQAHAGVEEADESPEMISVDKAG